MSRRNIPEKVLVVYNAVDAVSGKSEFLESNAGVLDEVKAVTNALAKIKIKYSVEAIRSLEHLADVLKNHEEKIVFNLIEELPANIADACYVPAICKAHGKVCTGSNTPALLTAQNKWHCKAVLKASGLPCPAGAVIPPGDKIKQGQLPRGKYIVKPVSSDASEGIDTSSIVKIPGNGLDKNIKRIHKKFNQPALVEQFISNREFNISLLQLDGEIKVLPIAEIDFSAFKSNMARIVDYSAKWHPDSFAFNNTPRVIPASVNKKAADALRACAFGAWQAAGCNDYIRVDFRMDENENVYIIEINPNPDITPGDGFHAALTTAGISYEKFVQTILKNTFARFKNGK